MRSSSQEQDLTRGRRLRRLALSAAIGVGPVLTAGLALDGAAVLAAGNQNCALGNTCVCRSNAVWNGSTNACTTNWRGWLAANQPSFAPNTYSNGAPIANNVLSIRTRDENTPVYCVYNGVNYVGALGIVDWWWDGYRNVPQGAESGRKRQVNCTT